MAVSSYISDLDLRAEEWAEVDTSDGHYLRSPFLDPVEMLRQHVFDSGYQKIRVVYESDGLSLAECDIFGIYPDGNERPLSTGFVSQLIARDHRGIGTRVYSDYRDPVSVDDQRDMEIARLVLHPLLDAYRGFKGDFDCYGHIEYEAGDDRITVYDNYRGNYEAREIICGTGSSTTTTTAAAAGEANGLITTTIIDPNG